MAEATTTPTAPATENKAVTAETKKYKVAARNKTWTFQEVVQTKGKGVGNTHNYLDPDGPFEVFFKNLAEAVGPENLYKCVMKEVIQPACRDAEHDLDAKLKDGEEYTPEQWIEAVFQQFLPGARSGADGIKQIREQLKVVMAAIKPLMEKYMQPAERVKMTQDDINRLLSLQAEFGELCEKEEGKSRKGKKGEKKSSATEAKK